MSRTLSEIYNQAKECRNNYLELTEFENKSKMSILDAFTWVTSTCIWAFENLLDVFKVDLARDLQNRINGTPAYFANALLKYQSGDELVMNEEGTAFSYASISEDKRVITKVSYSEDSEPGFQDNVTVFKVATGDPGSYSKIDDAELLKIRDYLNQLLFAGQHARVVSRDGDILILRLNVYFDGQVTTDELYDAIDAAIQEHIASVEFDGAIYVQRIIDSIQKVEHVVDVQATSSNNSHLGVYVASYDDNHQLIQGDNLSYEKRVDRYFVPNSGYVKESSGSDQEADFPKWRDSIILKLEDEI